jgi:hypothetical protein
LPQRAAKSRLDNVPRRSNSLGTPIRTNVMPTEANSYFNGRMALQVTEMLDKMCHIATYWHDLARY